MPETITTATALSYFTTRLRSEAARAARPKFDNLMDWGKYYFPKYFEFQSGKHHYYLSTFLRNFHVRPVIDGVRRGRKHVFLAPRDSAKSTYITFLDPLYAICEGLEKYIIIISEAGEQATKFMKPLKDELEFNIRLREDYPRACGVGPEWSAESFVTKNGIRVEGLGTGQKIRGRREGESRPSLIIVDDPQGDDVGYSPASRDHDWSWFTGGVLNAGTVDTNYVAVGTKIHRECIVGRLQNTPGWESMEWRSIMKWPKNMDLWTKWEEILRTPQDTKREQKALSFYTLNRAAMNEGAEVLWPAKEPLLSLMTRRAEIGDPAFQAEKQNNPIDPSKCEWGEIYFTGPNVFFDNWPSQELTLCKTLALDPSRGRQDKPGDFQAMVWLALGEDGIIYVDADMRKRPIEQMVKDYIGICDLFLPDIAGCEADQFQEVLRQVLDKASLTIPVMPITTENKPKIMRIRRLTPYIVMGRLKFRRNSPGVTELITQLTDFPVGEHDDGPDALEMAVRLMHMMMATPKQGEKERETQTSYAEVAEYAELPE